MTLIDFFYTKFSFLIDFTAVCHLRYFLLLYCNRTETRVECNSKRQPVGSFAVGAYIGKFSILIKPLASQWWWGEEGRQILFSIVVVIVVAVVVINIV